MKTLNQLIPSLFVDYSENLSRITELENKMSSISTSSSSFMNTISVTKLVSNQVNASKFESNILDAFMNVLDLNFERSGYDEYNRRVWRCINDNDGTSSDGAIITGKNFFDFITDKLQVHNFTDLDSNTSFDTIGYYQGIPIQCGVLKLADNVGDSFYPHTYAVALSLGLETIAGSYPNMAFNLLPFIEVRMAKIENTSPQQYSIILAVDNLSTDPYDTFRCNAYINGTYYTDYCVCSFEEIINESYNNYISNECMLNIIKRAQSDGNISRDQIESIINQYERTSFIDSLNSLIAGTSRFSDVSIVMLIGKIYQNMGADYDSGEAFSVYTEPNFITSVITAVVSILVTVVAIILSIIWRVVGVIIQVLASLISTLFGFIQNNINKTQASVVNQSLTPFINNPLLTFKLERGALSNLLEYKAANFDIDDVDDSLKEYGCVMVGPDYGGQSPYYYWILPRDWSDINSEYTIQLLITAAQSSGTNTGIPVTEYEEEDRDGGASNHSRASVLTFNYSTDPTTPLVTGLYYYGADDIDYKYINMTDDQLRLAIYTNTVKALADLTIMNPTMMNHTYTRQGYNDKGLVIDYFINPIILDADASMSPAYFTPENVTLCMKKSEELGYFTHLSTEMNDFTKLAWMSHILSFGYQYRTTFASTALDWDKLDMLFKYIHTLDISSNPGIGFNTYRPAQLSYFNLCDGHQAATASIEWPNLAKGALINSLVTTGLAVAVVAGIAVATKIGMKRFAFNRLSNRQMRFDTAKGKYDEMNKAIQLDKEHMGGYTKTEITAIQNEYRVANRKLTKAWSLAGKLGLSMYNGFATPGATMTASDKSSSPLTSLTTNILNNEVDKLNYDVSDNVEDYNNVLEDSALNTSEILHVIRGY